MSIAIVITNHNIFDVFISNYEIWEDFFYKNKCDVVFVDDNSDDFKIIKYKMEKFFPEIKLIRSFGRYSSNNFNQIKAIYTGISNLDFDWAYLWVIDADDVPCSNCFHSELNDTNKVYLVNQIIIDSTNQSENESVSISRGRLWYRGVTTSGLIIGRGFLERNFASIFSNKFMDVWFDMRVISSASFQNAIILLPSDYYYYRYIHGSNDSLRYTKSGQFLRCKRIMKTLAFYLVYRNA